MTELLRQYEAWEAGADGYPPTWHRASVLSRHGTRLVGTSAKLILPEHIVQESPAIKDLIREQAGHRCQRCGHPYRKGAHKVDEEGQLWSPCDDLCSHGGTLAGCRPAFEPGVHWEALWRILTVHHLDEDKLNCRWWNLAALCQRCHLRMQRAVVMGRPYHFEHSEWFKPHAAGFYAWKYLGEDLDREETMSRLDELLALEHRFTQEALL